MTAKIIAFYASEVLICFIELLTYAYEPLTYSSDQLIYVIGALTYAFE